MNGSLPMASMLRTLASLMQRTGSPLKYVILEVKSNLPPTPNPGTCLVSWEDARHKISRIFSHRRYWYQESEIASIIDGFIQGMLLSELRATVYPLPCMDTSKSSNQPTCSVASAVCLQPSIRRTHRLLSWPKTHQKLLRMEFQSTLLAMPQLPSNVKLPMISLLCAFAKFGFLGIQQLYNIGDYAPKAVNRNKIGITGYLEGAAIHCQSLE